MTPPQGRGRNVTALDSDESDLRRALWQAALGAPEVRADAAQIVRTGGRRIRRRRTVVLVAASLIVTGFVAGGTIIDRLSGRDGRLLPASAIPLDLTCASGLENAGTPTFSTDSGDASKTPLQLASDWAQGSGFSRAFPGVTAQQAAADNGNRVVFYSSPQGATIALLTYAERGGVWTLESVRSCA